MLTIRINRDVATSMRTACGRAGIRETGGMLFGEYLGPDEFRVIEATTHGLGRFASFVRIITDGFARLEDFFRRTRHDYMRFNYLGEWHSHPSFALHPSGTDDSTMQALVDDPTTRALFVVLIIVKLESGELQATAWAYFPMEQRRPCTIFIES